MITFIKLIIFSMKMIVRKFGAGITMLIFGAFWIFIRYILPMALETDLSLGIREIAITAAYFITAVILTKIKIDEWITEREIRKIQHCEKEKFFDNFTDKEANKKDLASVLQILTAIFK